MTGKSLFSKTMPFCMAKLGLGAILVAVCTILFAILMGIGWLFGDGGVFVSILIWLASIKAVHWAIMHYAGYLVKAGHVAVIAETMKTGQVPANQVNYGKQMVTERFLTSNVYYAIDTLISGAIKQIQGKIDKLGTKLDFVPGMEAVTNVAKVFVDISLGYVDECCLGWTFYNKEQSAFKSAADGVVIYVQNWKAILKNAAITVAKLMLALVLVVLVVFVPVGLVFKLLKWSGLAAFILACLIAWVFKFAFVDSYIMCQMMATYMQVAPTTTLKVDLYGTLCTFSKSFKELFQKGQAESPTPATATATAPAYTAQAAPTPTAPANKPVFCGQCGAKNERGTKFCGSCGAKL